MIGKKHTIKTCKKMSKSRKGKKYSKEWCENISKALKGIKFSKEHSKNISKGLKLGFLNGTIKINGNNKCWYDGVCYRSSYESTFAKFCDYNNIKFEYESKSCRFKLPNGHCYVIDFYLPEYNLFIETKGRCEEYAKYKINCAKEVLKDNYIVIYGTHIHLFDIEKYPLCEEGLKILTN